MVRFLDSFVAAPTLPILHTLRLAKAEGARLSRYLLT